MKVTYVSGPLSAVFLISLISVFIPRMAASDPIDDAENVPATAAEISFINRITEQVEASVPPIDGWEREIKIRASGNTVSDDRPVLIYERARDFPLKVSIRVDFKAITAADRQRTVEKKSAEELQQEMMTAAMNGDTQKLEQLQQQLAAMMQSQMEAGPMGQAVGTTPMAPVNKASKFHVDVIVNGDGETIGKKYEIEVPGVSRAFRSTGKDSSGYLSYRYYMGPWRVSELGTNWTITSPDEQTATNHLRALALLVSAGGDGDSVESYVNSSLDLDGLSSVVD